MELVELAEVFEIKGIKKLRYITVPSALKLALPSIVTASGLAWKSGIAAEVITYTRSSIGREIANAKNYLEGAEMFAWTLTVIALSIIIETLIKVLGKRGEKLWE